MISSRTGVSFGFSLRGATGSPETRALLTGPLKQIPELAVRTADPAAYVAALDGLCGAVGQHLVTHFGLERKGP